MDKKTQESAEGGPVDAATQPQALAPNSVAGQKHVSPQGRHSQQSHKRAEARMAALGLTTQRELHDHDRAEVLAKRQKGADGVLAQQRNEQNRRSGTSADKTE